VSKDKDRRKYLWLEYVYKTYGYCLNLKFKDNIYGKI